MYLSTGKADHSDMPVHGRMMSARERDVDMGEQVLHGISIVFYVRG